MSEEADEVRLMIIVAVDPGSIRCGYGVIRANGPRLSYVAAGVIEAPARLPLDRRLLEIGEELQAVCSNALDELYPDEDVACGIEAGYADGRATALVLGAARGVAIYVMRSVLRRDVREYQPAAVKSAVTGSGRASKDQVARVAMARLGMKRQPAADAGDALGVCIAVAQDGRNAPP